MKQTKVSRFGKIAVGIGVVAAAAGSIATLNVSAHHAFGAEFDPNRPLILRGPVTKVEWVNPHAWIHLEHTNEDGEKESWMVRAVLQIRFSARFEQALTDARHHIIVDGYQSKPLQ